MSIKISEEYINVSIVEVIAEIQMHNNAMRRSQLVLKELQELRESVKLGEIHDD